MNAFSTLLLFPFQPRRVALAHARTPMLQVYLIHWLGVACLAWLVIATGSVESFAIAFRFNPAWYVLGDLYAALILMLLAGEAVFLAVATLMTCWCGADEPVSESWRFAVRVSWLYVAHLWWVAGGVALMLHAIAHWDLNNGNGVLLLTTLALVIVWSIASYVRALTVDRPREHRTVDPLCEWCGYNLSHLDIAGRCPECGRPIAPSVADGTRRSINALYRGPANFVLTCGLAVFRSPEPLLRSITTGERSRLLVKTVVVSLAATAAAGGGGFVLAILIFRGLPDPLRWLFFFPIVALLIGLLVAWCYFVLASGAVSLIGLATSRRCRRNRLNAAFQLVALTSWIYPLWAGVGTFTLTRVRSDRIATVWFYTNLALAVVYLLICVRRMKYLQYANR